jgi:hypothetical protein
VRISAVYPSARLLSRKVKLFVDFMQQEFVKIPLLHPRTPSRPVPRIRAKTGAPGKAGAAESVKDGPPDA